MLTKLRPLFVPMLALLLLAMLSTTANADGTTVRIPNGCHGATATAVPAGSPVTIVSGWTMATRGNTQAFANAATGVMTIDGQPVSPTQSEVFAIPKDFEPLDAWRVQWSYTTTAPALGQTMVVTFTIVLSRDVVDHELGIGQPSILPAGQLYPPFTCTLIGS